MKLPQRALLAISMGATVVAPKIATAQQGPRPNDPASKQVLEQVGELLGAQQQLTPSELKQFRARKGSAAQMGTVVSELSTDQSAQPQTLRQQLTTRHELSSSDSINAAVLGQDEGGPHVGTGTLQSLLTNRGISGTAAVIGQVATGLSGQQQAQTQAPTTALCFDPQDSRYKQEVATIQSDADTSAAEKYGTIFGVLSAVAGGLLGFKARKRSRGWAPGQGMFPGIRGGLWYGALGLAIGGGAGALRGYHGDHQLAVDAKIKTRQEQCAPPPSAVAKPTAAGAQAAAAPAAPSSLVIHDKETLWLTPDPSTHSATITVEPDQENP